MGPHKGRGKLSPEWDSNQRPSEFLIIVARPAELQLMLVLDTNQFAYVIKNADLYFIDILIVAMNYPLSIYVCRHLKNRVFRH